MTRLIARALALLVTSAVVLAADPPTRPSTRTAAELPIVDQSALTHRQLVTLMDVLGLKLESRKPLTMGPDTFDVETWAKPDGKLRFFILWAGWRTLGEFHFEGIRPKPAEPPTRRRAGTQQIPGLRQFDLTRQEYVALMKTLGLESEGEDSRWNETWIKRLPDGGTLRIITEWNDQGHIRLNKIFFQGIPIR